MSDTKSEPELFQFDLYPTIGHRQGDPESVRELSLRLTNCLGFSVKFQMSGGLPVLQRGHYVFSTRDPSVARLLPGILEKVYNFRCLKHRTQQDRDILALQLDSVRKETRRKQIPPGAVVPSMMRLLARSSNHQLFNHSEAVLMGGDRISYMYTSTWMRGNPRILSPAHYAVLLAEGHMDGIGPAEIEVSFPNARFKARKAMNASGRIFSPLLMTLTDPNPSKPHTAQTSGSLVFFHP